MKPDPPSACGEAEGESGGCGGHDLEPGAVDEPTSARREHDDRGREGSGDDPGRDAVADLLDDEPERRDVARCRRRSPARSPAR